MWKRLLCLHLRWRELWRVSAFDDWEYECERCGKRIVRARRDKPINFLG